MSISSVGNQSIANTVMDRPVRQSSQVQRCNCDDEATESSVRGGADEDTSIHYRGPHHGPEFRHEHGHGERHGHGGHGFGRFAMGMGSFLQDQMRAARREVIGEQIGSAVADLSSQVSDVLAATGQQEGVQAAQQRFEAAIQDVVDRYDNGEIGRRGAMAGFSDAYDELVNAVKTGIPVAEPDATGAADAAAAAPAADTAAVAAAVTEPGAETAGTDPAATVDAVPASATDAAGGADTGTSVVENLGQAFNSFLQTLRSDFEALGGMRTLFSPENRDMIRETFVNMYRELAGLDTAATTAAAADTNSVDQMA
ncbi:MAG: hypothetical protein R3F42_11165 [Pseudomonadota bacterium]